MIAKTRCKKAMKPVMQQTRTSVFLLCEHFALFLSLSCHLDVMVVFRPSSTHSSTRCEVKSFFLASLLYQRSVLQFFCCLQNNVQRSSLLPLCCAALEWNNSNRTAKHCARCACTGACLSFCCCRFRIKASHKNGFVSILNWGKLKKPDAQRVN